MTTSTPQPGAWCTRGGVVFTVWAPNARQVELVGGFSNWAGIPMALDPATGCWSVCVAHAAPGDLYKYRVTGVDGSVQDKADPCALRGELPPGTASQVWELGYSWSDHGWMAERGERQAGGQPLSVYEVHLGSWQRHADGRFLNYRELGERLAAHCNALGFTHVELMPVAEHPFYGSWGYQTTGFYAPTARYGTPQDLMAMVDTLHREGIGVIVDWVGAHFPGDAHALARFDGTALYEHDDPRQGFHPQWNSLIFNYGRHEVRDFLIGSVLFWLRHYHVDAVRVDAVSSMLYLDFARQPGEWIPNHEGGHQNLEAVHFLQDLNSTVYAQFPDVHVIAEESTAWPGVSRPVHWGGLGFGMKWNMGWMNDTLHYMQRPIVYRKWHGQDIRFSAVYAFNENFVLPLSHDEVVYGKGSLLQRQPGDEWQRFAGLRALYGYMWGHPGKKLLFMGGEFAQPDEWHHETALDWRLTARPLHAGVMRWVADLNRAYRALPALHRHDFGPAHFDWASLEGDEPEILAFFRHHGDDAVLVVCNFSAQPRHGVPVGMPFAQPWHEILNSDAQAYGGSGVGNLGLVEAHPAASQHMPAMLRLTIPPLATILLSTRPLPPSAP